MLDGRVFVITGATGATAGAAAHAFAGRGASLALLSGDQTRLDSLAHVLDLPAARILTLAADLRKADAVHSAAEAVAAKFGRVDGLIHLVGGWTGGKTLSDASPDDLDSMLGQHAWTTFHLFRAFGRHLTANQWGRVIVVSASTLTHPPGKSGAYVAAKAAQEALVLTLAEELKDFGVTANIIQVRSIDADGRGKGTRPDEIAALMLYLCSDEAAKVNAARIPLF
jgi:NAD(P)-dependent dehydrogenase (short-subunit alcohol dehydrogenase family)